MGGIIHWWPAPISVGGAISVQAKLNYFVYKTFFVKSVICGKYFFAFLSTLGMKGIHSHATGLLPPLMGLHHS